MKRNLIKFILITFLSFAVISFLTHRLRRPQLLSLPDPSLFLISRGQLIPAIDNFVHNHKCSSDRTIIIVVESRPENFGQREIIRKTYGNYDDQVMLKYQVFFALGTNLEFSTQEEIRKENGIYNDILQWNFMDSYKNLVIKSTAIIKWASINCTNSEYIVKTDDDVYLNVYNLIQSKNILNEKAEKFGGKIIFGRTGNIYPARSYNSKWFMPFTIYSNNTFPKFVTGGGYVVSTVSTGELWKAVIDSTPVLINEDVTVTGTAAEKSGVPRFNDDEIYSLKTYYLNEILQRRKYTLIDWYYKMFPDRTDLRNTFYIGHDMNEEHFYVIHNFIKINQYFTVNDLVNEFKNV